MKAQAPVERAVLQAGPLSIDEVVARVRRPEAGAVAIFLGTVRDHNDGRAVVKLEYEAYPSMAVAEMRRIVAEIEHEVPGVVLAVAHRTGSLAVGEVAVVCAASSAHRGEAQRACRDLIDRIKERVPIWKREHGPDGAYWVGWKDARCAEDHGHDHDREPPPATSPLSPASKHRGHP
jgi:molybdopterin synthase catalytic subunit